MFVTSARISAQTSAKIKIIYRMVYYKKKSVKISKGYRLKPSTHKIIYKIQALINGDQDEAIAKACRKYYTELKKKYSVRQTIHLMRK